MNVLKQRILTAIILAPLVLSAAVWLPPGGFALGALLVMLLGAWEWAGLAGLSFWGRVLYLALIGGCCVLLLWLSNVLPVWPLYLAVLLWIGMLGSVLSYPRSQHYWSACWCRMLLGVVFLVAAWTGLVQLKAWRHDGMLIILLMLIIWGADSGAYFVGRTWGKVKLAPRVSPGKTWEGVAGGILAALLISSPVALYMGLITPQTGAEWLWPLLSVVLIVAVSVVGDLTVSMVKRLRGVKDSGHLLPGHGGILDRIDSLIAGLPFYTLLLLQLRA